MQGLYALKVNHTLNSNLVAYYIKLSNKAGTAGPVAKNAGAVIALPAVEDGF